MKLHPRQEILEVWKSIAQIAYRDGEWSWEGRYGTNSISDAEQLLCLIFPAAELAGFKLDSPDQTAEDTLAALAELGDSVQIPRLLIKVIREYLEKYSDEMLQPIFSGGSYFISTVSGKTATEEQQKMDVVDSYAMSVNLMLGTLGFLKVFRQSVSRDEILRDIRELELMCSKRLSAAMVGLLRSFTVNVFSPSSPAGQAMLRTVNQVEAPEQRILTDLAMSLRGVRAGLRDLTIGSGQVDVDLDNPNLLFECGWTWGIVKDAPEVETSLDVGKQSVGYATQPPILYFTVSALISIRDLFSERTRVLGLLNDDQITLAQALQRRWELTQSYWSAVAMYGGGRWPLEDVPWRTSDGKESDYYSLGVIAMVVQNLIANRATEADLARVAAVLEELALRARITRRAIEGEASIELHAPGIRVNLAGSDSVEGPLLSWIVSDFAVILLKRTIWVASLAQTPKLRERLLNLVDEVWEHLQKRRFSHGVAKGLWDQPSNVFPGVTEVLGLPSWYFTERIIEFLVEAAKTSEQSPLRSPVLADMAGELLSEAEHLYDQELLIWAIDAGQPLQTNLRKIEVRLQRARSIIKQRPGSSAALTIEVLRDLELLSAARRDASEGP